MKIRLNIHMLCAVVLSLCTIIALYANGTMPTTEQAATILSINHWFVIGICKIYLSMKTVTITESLLYIGLCYFYYKVFKETVLDKIACVLASIFAGFMVLGKSFHLYDSWEYVFANTFQLCMGIVQFFGWTILFYCLLVVLFLILEKRMFFGGSVNMKLWQVAGVIVICWLPFILAFLPATFDYDSFVMLKWWNGESAWSTHHPVIATAVLGVIMDLGLSLGSANIGALFCMIIQTILLVTMFVFLLQRIKKLGIKGLFLCLTLIYYALCPVWPAYAIHVIKDTVNLVFCVLYTICYIDILKDKTWINKPSNLILLSIAILGVCAFRNTGIYLVMLSLVPYSCYLAYKKIRESQKILTCILLCCFAVSFFNQNLISNFDIKAGSKGEMLSVPFQQTARYLKEYPEDVTAEEKQAISNLLRYDQLAEKYNPNLSDPVKGTMHSQNGEDIKAYFKAWGTMFLKHPLSYIETTMNSVYGYFYPDSVSKVRSTGIKLYTESKFDKNSPNTGSYDVMYIFENDMVRDGFIKYAKNFWRQIPILGMAYNTGVYTWILMICIALLIKHKKYYELFGTLPSVITILFCIVSPVNGYVRYMLPVMAVTPLIIAWTLYAIRQPDVKE